MSIVPSDVAPVAPSDVTPRETAPTPKPRVKRRRAAPRLGPVDDSVVANSPEDLYCPCANQNGTIDSPVWFFFRMHKTDRAIVIQLATSVIARSQTASLMMVWLCALPVVGRRLCGGIWASMGGRVPLMTTRPRSGPSTRSVLQVGWRPVTIPSRKLPRSPGGS